MDKKELASYYSEHHIRQKRSRFCIGGGERGNQFKKWIGTDKTILDLGCRDGTLTEYYQPQNTILGVDVDLNSLTACKDKLGIQTIWLDINNEELPLNDEEIDVVVAGEILEHIFYPDLFLKKIYRVLKKNGLFIGSVPNAFRLKNRLKFLFGIQFEDDKTHLRHLSILCLKKLLGNYFDEIEIKAISSRFLMLSPKLFGNTLIWKCIKSDIL